MIRILSIGIFFLFGCNQKNPPQSEIQENKLIVNKNYIFCGCLNNVNRRYNLQWKNPENKSIVDGSIEVYFIKNNFDVNMDSVDVFVNNYLDSLENNNLFRSYNANSLGVAKCLELYNSKKLDIFLKKEFSRKE